MFKTLNETYTFQSLERGYNLKNLYARYHINNEGNNYNFKLTITTYPQVLNNLSGNSILKNIATIIANGINIYSNLNKFSDEDIPYNVVLYIQYDNLYQWTLFNDDFSKDDIPMHYNIKDVLEDYRKLYPIYLLHNISVKKYFEEYKSNDNLIINEICQSFMNCDFLKELKIKQHEDICYQFDLYGLCKSLYKNNTAGDYFYNQVSLLKITHEYNQNDDERITNYVKSVLNENDDTVYDTIMNLTEDKINLYDIDDIDTIVSYIKVLNNIIYPYNHLNTRNYYSASTQYTNTKNFYKFIDSTKTHNVIPNKFKNLEQISKSLENCILRLYNKLKLIKVDKLYDETIKDFGTFDFYKFARKDISINTGRDINSYNISPFYYGKKLLEYLKSKYVIYDNETINTFEDFEMTYIDFMEGYFKYIKNDLLNLYKKCITNCIEDTIQKNPDKKRVLVHIYNNMNSMNSLFECDFYINDLIADRLKYLHLPEFLYGKKEKSHRYMTNGILKPYGIIEFAEGKNYEIINGNINITSLKKFNIDDVDINLSCNIDRIFNFDNKNRDNRDAIYAENVKYYLDYFDKFSKSKDFGITRDELLKVYIDIKKKLLNCFTGKYNFNVVYRTDYIKQVYYKSSEKINYNNMNNFNYLYRFIELDIDLNAVEEFYNYLTNDKLIMKLETFIYKLRKILGYE